MGSGFDFGGFAFGGRAKDCCFRGNICDFSLCAALVFVKRYKNFKLSKLFVKNPNLSLLLFAVENLSLGAFYGGFLACLAAGYFWGRACRRLERGVCICIRARLSDRFRDLVCV